MLDHLTSCKDLDYFLFMKLKLNKIRDLFKVNLYTIKSETKKKRKRERKKRERDLKLKKRERESKTLNIY